MLLTHPHSLARMAGATQTDEREAAWLESRFELYLREVNDVDRFLVYGNEARNSPGLRSPILHDLLREVTLYNGCAGVWGNRTAQAHCATFYNGLLRHGIHAAVTAYQQHARELVAMRKQVGREATLRSQYLALFDDFINFYLEEAVVVSNTRYREASAADIEPELRSHAHSP